MGTKDIVVTLAEKEMAFRLHFAGTEVPFLYYGGKEADRNYEHYVQVDRESVVKSQLKNKCSASVAEIGCLLIIAGNELLREGNRMLFHGVAMTYKGRGYILTAPSGTGKSTQFRNLHEIYGDECRVINGDKPVVRRVSENEIRIYPSPWNGKENWAGKENAALTAVIWLEQGLDNRIEKPEISDMILPIFNQVLYSAPDTQTVHEACGMVDSILSSVPVYRFVNTGDIESSKMLAEFLDREAEKEREI